jgi:hypothetical protein
MGKAKLLLLVVLCLLIASTAWPQAGVSSVRGVARDQTQAVVPNAVVTLTNTATNSTLTTKTNDVGIYVFPAVVPGPYHIRMEAVGLQRFEGAFTLMVQQELPIDGVLTVGQTTTQVEVKDVTPLVVTDTPTLGHTLENQRILQLPQNGRSYQNLFATVPGIDSTGIPQAYGMRNNTSVTLFDGTPVNETYEGWDFSRPPGLDSIEEVHVEINNSSAKFTRPATVILSSKSGTNSPHGALFETNRNSGYGVARRRQDFFANGKPPFVNRNEFGASLGGPVYIPKVYNGKNKTFFFFAFEASRNPNASTQQYTVPTQAMRNGDFRGLVDSSGRQYQLYDPMTTDPVTNQRQLMSCNGIVNTICPDRLSPTAKYLFGITPLPTLPDNPLIGINWQGAFKGISRGSNTSVRIDQRISDRDLIYGRYSYNTSWSLSQYAGQPMLNNVSGVETTIRPNQTVGVTWVRTFSPTLTNELVTSFSRENEFRGMGDQKTNYVSTLLALPNNFQKPNWPDITNLGLSNYKFGSDGLFYLITQYVAVQDNATKVMGKHEFEFGFHSRFEHMDKVSGKASSFDFGSLATSLYDPTSTASSPQALPFTGYDLANMYLGVVNATNKFIRPKFLFRRREFALYLQDNWKATSRLTLNLGLRYEVRPPIFDAAGSLISFDMNKQAYVVGTDSVDQYVQKGLTLPSILQALNNFGGNIVTNKEVGWPKHLFNTNWAALGPRLGVAYRAFDGKKQFVIRSGFRISYYPQKLQDWVGGMVGSAPSTVSYTYSNTDPTLSPDGLPNIGLRSVPRYIAGVNTGDSMIDTNSAKLLTRGSFGATFLPHDYKDGGVADWNFTLEKQVMSNTVARIAYVGNYGFNSQHYIDYNDSTPAYIWYMTQGTALPTGAFANVATRPLNNTVYGNENFFSPTGYSHHTSFQFELERRYAKGFGYQIFYRTAKTLLIDQDTDGTQGGETVHSLNFYLPNSVPTDVHARDRFLNYRMDTNTPRHQVRWNFIADLPVGRGKKLGNNMNKVLDQVVGGWQIAGAGQWRTNYFALPTNWWSVDPTIQVYNYKNSIQDCTTGTCYPGYLFWNGYVPANLLNSVDANGKPNGYEGIPSNYKSSAQYLIPWSSTALPANAPANTTQATIKSLWDTNTVWIPLKDGTVQRTTFNNNLNPWRNQYVGGPNQWFQDASLFKFFRIKERVTFRFNIDFFNVFNNPNNPTSVASTGILSTRNSGSSARVTQLTGRLQW